MTEKQPDKVEMEEFSVEHQMPPVSQYCNHMIVQGDTECLYLTFFQLRPPVMLDTDLEVTKTPMEPSKERKTVKAMPVASVVIDRAKMQRFIDVLQQQVNVWKADDASDVRTNATE